jgi:hypothetical protein
MSIPSTGHSKWETRALAAKSKCATGPPDLNVALVVRPKVAWKMLDCGVTHGYALIAKGEIESFLDGRSRKIIVESIHRYIARRLALANKNTNLQPPVDEDTKPRRGRGRPRNQAA